MLKIDSYNALRRVNTIFKVSRNVELDMFLLITLNVVTKKSIIRFVSSESDLYLIVNFILESEKE